MGGLRRMLKAGIAVNTSVMGKLSSALTGGRLGRMEKRQIGIERRVNDIHKMLRADAGRKHDQAQEALLQNFLDRLTDPL